MPAPGHLHDAAHQALHLARAHRRRHRLDPRRDGGSAPCRRLTRTRGVPRARGPVSRGAASDAAPRDLARFSPLAWPGELGLGSVAVKRGGRATSRRRGVELGFNLPSRGPLARVDVLTRLVRAADTLGYSVVTISDHVVLPTRSSAPYPYDHSGAFP